MVASTAIRCSRVNRRKAPAEKHVMLAIVSSAKRECHVAGIHKARRAQESPEPSAKNDSKRRKIGRNIVPYEEPNWAEAYQGTNTAPLMNCEDPTANAIPRSPNDVISSINDITIRAAPDAISWDNASHLIEPAATRR